MINDPSIENELFALFKRSNELLAIIAKVQMSNILRDELKDAKHQKLYQLTGSRSVKELAKTLGMSTGAISRLWQRWEDVGLLIKDGKSYRRAF